tara:strand:+ start:588 stop:797 length:210 start_codon:yes stop_codon:yes gene_type:complete
MKVGDLVRRKPPAITYENSKLIERNTLAIVIGFDYQGDLRLRHVNPAEGWENMEDVDYKNAWELVNATN